MGLSSLKLKTTFPDGCSVRDILAKITLNLHLMVCILLTVFLSEEFLSACCRFTGKHHHTPAER